MRDLVCVTPAISTVVVGVVNAVVESVGGFALSGGLVKLLAYFGNLCFLLFTTIVVSLVLVNLEAVSNANV